MPKFAFEALDKGGKPFTGTLEAPSEEVIVDKLRGMGYYPLNVKQQKAKASEFDIAALPIIRNIAHHIGLKDLVVFTRQLATLIDAGLPILRSLVILEEQVKSIIFKDVIKKVQADIEGGSSLSEALAKHPKVFDKLYVNMVRAGEIGGVLESILNKIAEFLEKRQALRSKVRSAMMYPVTILILATGIVTFIMLKIIPKFQDIFDQLGAEELPKLTEILIDASWILAHRSYIVIGVLIVLILLIRKANQTRRGKYFFDSIKMGFPIFGDLFKKLAIQRFAGTLATLITSGVPILQALDITRESSGNEVLSRVLEKVYHSVKDGETINQPLKESKLFPPLVYHMVAVGEETGAIDHMLNKVAEAYEREVDDKVNALASILEPVMLVVLGALVGFIVIALYLPLFSIPKILGKE